MGRKRDANKNKRMRKNTVGMFRYFNELDEDASGFLEKDEVKGNFY